LFEITYFLNISIEMDERIIESEVQSN